MQQQHPNGTIAVPVVRIAAVDAAYGAALHHYANGRDQRAAVVILTATGDLLDEIAAASPGDRSHRKCSPLTTRNASGQRGTAAICEETALFIRSRAATLGTDTKYGQWFSSLAAVLERQSDCLREQETPQARRDRLQSIAPRGDR